MVILDLQQIFFSTLLSSPKHSQEIDENFLRHMILNTIRANRVKFKSHGEFVIACDSKDSWRKSVFPYYKHHRKAKRDVMKVNWEEIFRIFNLITEELREHFPYKIIKVAGAEADDIIGTLAKSFPFKATDLELIIVSGDKDFVQLQTNAVIKQFDPIRKRWLTVESVRKHWSTVNDPVSFLKEHIYRGDKSDGIPNILSSDDSLVMSMRQPPISQKRINRWNSVGFENDFSLQRNYDRNRILIDLTNTPEKIKSDILEAYNNAKTESKLFDYFRTHKLKYLMENISDF